MIGGFFTPGAEFDPTAPGGLDVILHDGPAVVPASHVPAGAFATSGDGRVARFSDRTGALPGEVTRFRLKGGDPGERHGFVGTGRLMAPVLSPAPTRRMTLRAGSACASGIAACVVTAGGKNERCN